MGASQDRAGQSRGGRRPQDARADAAHTWCCCGRCARSEAEVEAGDALALGTGDVHDPRVASPQQPHPEVAHGPECSADHDERGARWLRGGVTETLRGPHQQHRTTLRKAPQAVAAFGLSPGDRVWRRSNFPLLIGSSCPSESKREASHALIRGNGEVDNRPTDEDEDRRDVGQHGSST